jgi:hypothetical protein
MPQEIMYTQEQLDIELIKQKNSTFEQTLIRIEQKVDSHFHWMLGCILGLYGISVTGLIAAIGKAYGVL